MVQGRTTVGMEDTVEVHEFFGWFASSNQSMTPSRLEEVVRAQKVFVLGNNGGYDNGSSKTNDG